jgi:hypothetical protein
MIKPCPCGAESPGFYSDSHWRADGTCSYCGMRPDSAKKINIGASGAVADYYIRLHGDGRPFFIASPKG